MRVLVIYANPVRSSFGAALHETVIRKLTANGHQCDDCDLYAEAFDPIMSEKERSQYHDTERNRLGGVSRYPERILRSGIRAGRELQDRRRWIGRAESYEAEKASGGMHLRRGPAQYDPDERSATPSRQAAHTLHGERPRHLSVFGLLRHEPFHA